MMRPAEEARKEAVEVFQDNSFLKWKEQERRLFLETALIQADYLQNSGRLNEAAELCVDMLGRKPGPEMECSAYRLFVDICIKKNDLRAAEACVLNFLKRATELQQLQERHCFLAESKFLFANVAEARGDLEKAVKLGDEALLICQHDVSGSKKSLSNEMVNVTRRYVLLYTENGEWNNALVYMDPVLHYYEVHGPGIGMLELWTDGASSNAYAGPRRCSSTHRSRGKS